MAVIVATRANYWISSTALSITLNALGEPNRIQASVASGAVIMCYIRGVEGLDFDNGHNYRRWPLTISPTYFNSNTEKYLYVAIPRSNTIGSDAMVVFPSQKLDIYGYAVVENPETHEQTQGEQIGTDDYYYIWLQGIITSSGESGSTPRDWSQRPDYGILRTDEATDSTETNWYRWDPITQTVTFLKDIWMEAASAFNNLRVKKMIFNGHELNGVAVKDVTPSDSDDTIVTPAYLDGLTDGKYIRKDQDDRTDFSLGVGGNLTVDGEGTFNGSISANNGVRTDEVRSNNYTGDTIADTGFLLTAGMTNGLGHSKLTIDEIYVRMKATFESLEVKKWNVTAGDEIHSLAANVINRVDYYTDTGELLGYTEKRVPWLMKRVPFLLKLFGNVQSQWGRYLYSKIVRMRVTLSNDDVARIAYCRCYFLADDGDTTIENWWQRDDLVRCQTMNITSTVRNTYTNIQRKAGNVFWWRKCIRVSANGVAPSESPDNVRCQPAIIDEKTYHWFDVVFNGAIEYDPVTGQMTGRTDGNFMANSDLPAAGDHAIQFGNTTIPGRMNLWITMVNGGSTRDYDPDGDAPCIKGFTGIYTFDLSKCFTGGNPCKMTLAPGKKYHFYGREFRVIKEYGEVPMPTQRGAWLELPLELDENNNQLTYPDDIYNDQGAFVSRGGYIIVGGVKQYGSAENPIPRTYARKCYWYDEVTHKGGTWLCSITEGSHWVADVAFTDAGRSFAAGDIVPSGIYAALDIANKAKCSSHENYTTDEPSGISASWTNLTKGITTMETRYRKKARLKYNSTLQKYEVDPDAGIIPPAEPWAQWYTLQQWEAIQRSGTEPSPENQIMQDGDYMWSCTMTEFSSDNPVFEYKVMRWGIDSDGLKMNSYFLGLSNTSIIITPSNDNYKMPGDSGWDAAAPQGKWWDTFDAMAAANGGVGAMQGWNVWTKTVIHYDLAENKSPDEQKPDLVQYTCSRIGQDGQIAQEEYYMLAESDDFATVFGNPAQAASYYYAKTGIRWYTEDTADPADLPQAENYRLSTKPDVPHICTKESEKATSDTPVWSPLRPAYDKAVHGARIYLWNFEQRIDGMGTEYATRPLCIGNHARGIMGVRELYACSAFAKPQDGRLFPNDIYDQGPGHPYTDLNVWTDEIYDRSPSEAMPYQWNWTRTLYSSPKDDQDTARDAMTGYFYEDHYHVSAVRGTNGEDGAGEESIFILSTSNPYSGTHPKNVSRGRVHGQGDWIPKANQYDVDDYVPEGWSDNPLPISPQMPYEFVSTRKLGATDAQGRRVWGDFSDPVLRSNWGKTGVDGDGTEYVFIRTKKNIAPTFGVNDGGNATDYKSMEWLPYISNQSSCGAESNRCTDDPKDVSREWPYEWCAKRTMGSPSTSPDDYGHRDWKSYYECSEVTEGGVTTHRMSLWKNYSDNSVRLALDNEHEDFLYNENGTLISPVGGATSNIRLYDGSNEITSFTPVIDTGRTSGATASITGKVLTVSGLTADSAEVVVKTTYNGADYYAKFTANKVTGDKYDIVVNPNAIAFNKSEAWTDKTITIKYNRVDAQGGSEKNLSPSPTQGAGNVCLYYSYVNNDGSLVTPALNFHGSSSFTLGKTAANSYAGIYFEIRKLTNAGGSAYRMCDYETVEIAKAENGTSPWIADLDNEMDSVACNNGGYPVQPTTLETTVSLWHGSTLQNITTVKVNGTEIGTSAKTIGIFSVKYVAVETKKRKIQVTVGTASVLPLTNSLAIEITDGTETRNLSFIINGVRPGANGEPATVYNLVPSVSEIIYTKAGSYSPTSLSCYCTSLADGVGKDNPSEATMQYSYNDSDWSNFTPSTSFQSSVVASNGGKLYLRLLVNSKVMDKETIPVVKDGIDGTSPWVADIDNEMDSISCYDSGKPIKAQSVQTKLAMYYGSSLQEFTVAVKRNGTAMTIGTASGGVTVSYNSGNRIMTVSYTTSATVNNAAKDDYEIRLTSTDGSSIYRVLHLTVNAVSGDVYNLLPSESQISVGRTATGGYNPSTYDLRCGYTRKDIEGNVTTVSDVTGQIDSKYNVYFRLHQRSNLSWQSTYYLYTSSKSTVTSLNIASYDAVEFVLSTSTASSTTSPAGIIDRETVPVVADGSDGDDGSGFKKVNTYVREYTLSTWKSYMRDGESWSLAKAAGSSEYYDNSHIKAGDTCYIVGKVSDLLDKDGNKVDIAAYGVCTSISTSTIYMNMTHYVTSGKDGTDGKYHVEEFARGSSRSNYAPQYIDATPGSSPIDGTPGWRPTAPSATTTYPYIWMRTAEYDPNTNTYGSWNYVCQTGKDGPEGPQGKTGRMFYLAGEWKNNVTYTRNDKVCPIVEWNNNYWYLIKDSSYNDEPSASSTYWEVAPNFGVVLTEALFTQFAKLGGFVVAGDFFISQYGTLHSPSRVYNEGASHTYTYFDENDPMVQQSFSSGYKFRPVLCINAVTGEAWFAGGKIHLERNGSVTVEGTIKAKTLFRSCQSLMLGHGTTDSFAANDYICDLKLYMQGKFKNSDGSYSEITPQFTELPDVLFVGCRVSYTSANAYTLRLPRPENYQGRMIDIYGEQNMGLTVNASGSVTGYSYSVVHLTCAEDGQSGSAACFIYPFSTTPRDAIFYFNDRYYGDEVHYAHLQLISTYINNRWLWAVINRDNCHATNFDFN